MTHDQPELDRVTSIAFEEGPPDEATFRHLLKCYAEHMCNQAKVSDRDDSTVDWVDEA